MQKDKCVICTIGTSIANGCELQLEYFNPGHAWEEDTKIFEQQINLRVTGLKNTIHKISAEINSLERLGLTTMSKVVLLAADNAASKACANELKKILNKFLVLRNKILKLSVLRGYKYMM
ncbi:hypothetical protein [Acinetobacter sp. P8-3-8]|uniref:hypothetical protein n=1 Tax=Acinetobacter sp. P8-3-8 TaxID=1029823 RepID=UPI000248569F|nr:hypothetical protein [Acinetobacter sp. P8-3-8]